MAQGKKVTGLIKLQIPAGQANPSPPVGPALGQQGVNIMEFCKAFNAQTQSQAGTILPVVIEVVDTEGQVDRFIKRLQVRDSKRQEAEERAASKTPLTLPIAELSLNSRYIKELSEAGITTAGDFLSHLESDGEDKLAEAPGINPKLIHDVKKQLTERGYNVPNAEAEA